MAYNVHSLPGAQPIANTETTRKHVLGTLVRAWDETYGEGEFIYLLGVTGTVVGSVVTYNATTYQTALSPDTANFQAPVAVAMSANVGSQYGWYQVSGNAVVKKTAVAVTPQVKVYQSATTGRVMPTSASGKQILGAKTANLTTIASGTSTVVVTIQRPHMQGQIT
jgi:hypothetical protein